MKNLQHFTDGTAAAHQFSVVQYGGLAGGGSTLRLVKAHAQCVGACLPRSGPAGGLSVAQLCQQAHRTFAQCVAVQDAAAARLRTFTP